MKHEDIKEGDFVVYIPNHLLMGAKDQMVKDQNLGVVTSKNDQFVRYPFVNPTRGIATNASDLFTLRERPDLIEKLESLKNKH